jgi:Ni2+-binding GTPase involved in maturation of urease and hydrogenase
MPPSPDEASPSIGGDPVRGARLQFRCGRCGLTVLVSRPAGADGRDATCPIDDAGMARWDGPPFVRSPRGVSTLVVGIGGPAGSGKSTLIQALRRRAAGRFTVATPGDDAPTSDLLLLERTGGAAAMFSPAVVDATIGVVDLATAARDDCAGARWRLLVVTKTDGATAAVDLRRLERSLRDRRGGGPVILADLTAVGGVDPVLAWLERELLLGL